MAMWRMFHSNCVLSPGSILLAVSYPIRINGAKSCLLLAQCSERSITLVYEWVISMCLRAVSGVRKCTTLMVEAGKEQPDRTQGFNSNIVDILHQPPLHWTHQTPLHRPVVRFIVDAVLETDNALYLSVSRITAV